MSKTWRWLAPAAIAGCVLAAGTVSAQADSPTAYGVTIGATSPNYPGAKDGLVDGHALVIYKTTHDNWDQATIRGTVTGFASGDVVSLLQEPFGTASFSATGAAVTLTSSGSYSFSVTPSLATKYEVEVSTAGSVDITSGTRTVYVTVRTSFSTAHTKCNSVRSLCTFSFKFYVYVPGSAYKTESRKHLYGYLAQWYSSRGSATWYYLSTTARASGPVKVNRGEIEYSLTFTIHLRAGQNYWETYSCTKADEKQDGLGLPGHHGCGGRRISATTIYVG